MYMVSVELILHLLPLIINEIIQKNKFPLTFRYIHYKPQQLKLNC